MQMSEFINTELKSDSDSDSSDPDSHSDSESSGSDSDSDLCNLCFLTQLTTIVSWNAFFEGAI